jgi:hypothetical protein
MPISVEMGRETDCHFFATLWDTCLGHQAISAEKTGVARYKG